MKRILISRMKFIGDIVLTTPVIRSVRDRYPDAFIAYLGEKHAVSLLEHNPALDAIIPFDFSRPAVVEQPMVILRLRKYHFDAVVDLFCNPRTALLMYASGAPIRIGKESRSRGAFYTQTVVDDGKPKTAVEFHYTHVAPIDVTPNHFRTEIFVTDAERSRANELLRSHGLNPEKPIVGFHPGATWPAKMWPAGRFGEAALQTARDLGAQVLFTRGPNDGNVISETLRAAGGRGVALPLLPLRNLAAVLSLCSVYVSNDCGPMHMSVAVSTPTIGIFGPGEDSIWFPYLPPVYDVSAGHCALRHDVACHPCHLDFCNRSGDGYMECMRGLSVETVVGRIAGMLHH